MINLLKSHASVRKYKDEPILDEIFHEMIEAAQHAASSNFVQAYSVIQVKDIDKKEKLGKLSKNETQFQTAALSLIFCADLKRVETAVQMNGEEMKGDMLESFVVATIDTTLFAQNFVIAAESKGYGICYIGGVRNNPKEISELFNLPNYVIPLFGMTVGVPDEQNEVKPRLPVDSVVHVDTYNEDKYEEQLETYDKVMNAYFNKRLTNQKDVTWSGEMVKFLKGKRREHLQEFVMSKGFLKDQGFETTEE